MPRIPGVVTEKNAKGEITFVTINVKKHRETIMPVLEQMGVVEKSKFMQEFEKGIPVKEGFKIVKAHINDLWKK
ncbi:hypothetical protein [Ferruginibacter sp.]|jgi:hypothetical protein